MPEDRRERLLSLARAAATLPKPPASAASRVAGIRRVAAGTAGFSSARDSTGPASLEKAQLCNLPIEVGRVVAASPAAA